MHYLVCTWTLAQSCLLRHRHAGAWHDGPPWCAPPSSHHPPSQPLATSSISLAVSLKLLPAPSLISRDYATATANTTPQPPALPPLPLPSPHHQARWPRAGLGHHGPEAQVLWRDARLLQLGLVHAYEVIVGLGQLGHVVLQCPDDAVLAVQNLGELLVDLQAGRQAGLDRRGQHTMERRACSSRLPVHCLAIDLARGTSPDGTASAGQ